ncbi:hypothetical protein ICE98_00469 [Lactococcus lactis]|nr:hypothetical protein [Lactococcus lactis]
MDWKLLVKNTTTEIQNNPLLLDSATDFNAQLYNLVSDTDDTWLPGAFVNLGSLKATGEQTMLVLSTEPDNSLIPIGLKFSQLQVCSFIKQMWS